MEFHGVLIKNIACTPFQIFSENRFPNYLLSSSFFSSSRWQSLGRFQRKHAAARKTCLSTRAYTHPECSSSTRTSTILCLMDLVTARKERERGGRAAIKIICSEQKHTQFFPAATAHSSLGESEFRGCQKLSETRIALSNRLT